MYVGPHVCPRNHMLHSIREVSKKAAVLNVLENIVCSPFPLTATTKQLFEAGGWLWQKLLLASCW